MKNKIYIFALAFLAVGIISAQSFMRKNEDTFPEKHLNIVLRNIGHQLLLKTGDSTSSVLPIKKINDQTFQIEFLNPFAFKHDDLIELISKNLKTNHLPSDYIVNVLKCNSNSIIFGFEMSTRNDNLTPCTGRTQNIGCYIVQIEFLANPSTNIYPYLLLLIPLTLVGYFFGKKILKNEQSIQLSDNEEFITIGNSRFYEQKQILQYSHELIELTENEHKLLKIFTEEQNQLVDRERLLKEIWEDKGSIVVGRSLDVLVSKLRKKLSNDKALKIINVHGKGYKMMVE